MTIKCYVDDGRKVSLLVPLLIAMRQFLSTYMYVLLVDMEPLTLILLFGYFSRISYYRDKKKCHIELNRSR